MNTMLIACDVVVREFQSRVGASLPVHTVDPTLHAVPDRLRTKIQSVIDQEEIKFDTLILGYGLCSRAVEGLKSKCSRIIIPRVDDCIGLFLGSRIAHKNQVQSEPGTFFLSRGWVESGLTPFEEYKYMIKRFGQKRADQLMETLLKNYTSLAYINMDKNGDTDSHHRYARSKAEQFGLEYKEISGSPTLFDELINGGESPHLQVIEPGDDIQYKMFIEDKK